MGESVDYEKYKAHYSEESFWTKNKKFAQKAGGKVIFTALKLYYALMSKETPAWAKSVIAGALGYFILPVDLVPDLIPMAGFTDDLGVLMAALGTVAIHITDEVENQAQEKMSDWFDDRNWPLFGSKKHISISICIPIYNYDVRPLISRLRDEASKTQCNVEIVCIDDGSKDEYLAKNAEIERFVKYVKLEQNVGRAKIRNLFLNHTAGDFLLFLDDDCLTIPKGFLKKYSDSLHQNSEVIVGGSIYDDSYKDREHRLRWMYGKRVEGKKNAEERNKEPYLSFMTNNFVIRRDIFERIRFDERISGYGHEDTLFGYRLKQFSIRIKHIDNAVVNGDIDTNEQFLNKTVESIKNLVTIRRFVNEPAFDESVRLLRTYRKVRKMNITWAVRLWHHMTKKCLEKRFKRGRGFTLTLFNIYKLGEFVDCVTA